MDTAQAEARIAALVQAIDEARARGDDAEVRRIEDEILEVKKLTGPRTISGTGNFTIPLPRKV